MLSSLLYVAKPIVWFYLKSACPFNQGRRQGVAGPLQYFFSGFVPAFNANCAFHPIETHRYARKKWLGSSDYPLDMCFSFKDFATNLDVAMISMLLSLDDEAIDCVVMDSWLISFELLFFTQWSYDCCLVNQYYGRHDRNLPPTRTNTRELIREWAISWRSIPLDFIFVSSLQLATYWELFFLKGFGHYSFYLAASN